jgi:hypothetical protein
MSLNIPGSSQVINEEELGVITRLVRTQLTIDGEADDTSSEEPINKRVTLAAAKVIDGAVYKDKFDEAARVWLKKNVVDEITGKTAHAAQKTALQTPSVALKIHELPGRRSEPTTVTQLFRVVEHDAIVTPMLSTKNRLGLMVTGSVKQAQVDQGAKDKRIRTESRFDFVQGSEAVKIVTDTYDTDKKLPTISIAIIDSKGKQISKKEKYTLSFEIVAQDSKEKLKDRTKDLARQLFTTAIRDRNNRRNFIEETNKQELELINKILDADVSQLAEGIENQKRIEDKKSVLKRAKAATAMKDVIVKEMLDRAGKFLKVGEMIKIKIESTGGTEKLKHDKYGPVAKR